MVNVSFWKSLWSLTRQIEFLNHFNYWYHLTPTDFKSLIKRSTHKDTLVDGQPKGEFLLGGELDRHWVQVEGPEQVEAKEGDDGVEEAFQKP